MVGGVVGVFELGGGDLIKGGREKFKSLGRRLVIGCGVVALGGGGGGGVTIGTDNQDSHNHCQLNTR